MSSNSSQDSEKPDDSKLNLYKKFIKQNLKIVMIAYNRKIEFKPDIDGNIET